MFTFLQTLQLFLALLCFGHEYKADGEAVPIKEDGGEHNHSGGARPWNASIWRRTILSPQKSSKKE